MHDSSLAAILPSDYKTGRFVGRIADAAGPTPVLVQSGQLYDMSRVAPTVSELLERWPKIGIGEDCGSVETFSTSILLAPFDLQCIKAAGVTFAASTLERVIEERTRGDAAAAETLREALEARIGKAIRDVVPGSPEAERLKHVLIGDGLWSQYLEVAIGPDAEIFTKAPVLSAIGYGKAIGIRSDSSWNNSEPEIALAVTSTGRIVGATLGNDVNLRDFEGRSALLLGKAKDNNASCAVGPFIRLFDDDFTLDDVRNARVDLLIEGKDNFRLEGHSSMDQLSRDPLELVRQATSEHQYPDGFALFCGTLFAPTDDRDTPGQGFTHKVGDIVRIASERLGLLANEVTTSAAAPSWSFGIGAMIRNLASRGLLH